MVGGREQSSPCSTSGLQQGLGAAPSQRAGGDPSVFTIILFHQHKVPGILLWARPCAGGHGDGWDPVPAVRGSWTGEGDDRPLHKPLSLGVSSARHRGLSCGEEGTSISRQERRASPMGMMVTESWPRPSGQGEALPHTAEQSSPESDPPGVSPASATSHVALGLSPFCPRV